MCRDLRPLAGRATGLTMAGMAHAPPEPVALTHEDCMGYLSQARVGRVIHTEAALPAATPVFYALHDGAIVFRTRPGSSLARRADGAIVAFEVDCVDEDLAAGWSVIATGPAARLHYTELSDAQRLPLLTWPGDDRSVFFRIQPVRLAGSRVEARLPSTAGRSPRVGSADLPSES